MEPDEITHVFAILIDIDRRKIGLNLLDSTSHKDVEGKICLFGGPFEPTEDSETAIIRKLNKELPGFFTDIQPSLYILGCSLAVYLVATDFSENTNRGLSRIKQFAEACKDGDAVVRTFDWVIKTKETDWLSPKIRDMIIGLISLYENNTFK